MSFLHEDINMFRRPRTSDGNQLATGSRPGFGRSVSFQPSHKPTPSHPPPSPKIWPERAKTWQRINRLAENVDAAYANATPNLPDQQPFLIYSETFSNLLGSSPRLSLLITDPRAPYFSSGGVFIRSLSTLYLTSSLIRDSDPAAVSSAQKRSEISKVEFYSEHDFTRDKVRCPERSYMAAGCCVYHGADGPGLVFAAQGSLKEPAGLVYVSSTRPHKTRMLLTNFRGVPFNSPRDIVSNPLDDTIYFTDPAFGYEQGFRPKPQLPTGHIYRFDPDSGDTRVMASGFTRPCGLCFSPDGSTLYVSDADAGRNSGITLYAFDVSHYSSKLSSSQPNGSLPTNFGTITITPPNSGPNSASSHHQTQSNSTSSSTRLGNGTMNGTTINPTAQLSPPNSTEKSHSRPKLSSRTASAISLGSRSRSRGPQSPLFSPQPLNGTQQLQSTQAITIQQPAAQSQPFLCNKRVFSFSPSSGTGNLAICPSDATLWLATSEGVEIWAPWGELVGKIMVSEGNRGVTGLAFGKGDGGGWDVFLMGGERLWGVKFG